MHNTKFLFRIINKNIFNSKVIRSWKKNYTVLCKVYEINTVILCGEQCEHKILLMCDTYMQKFKRFTFNCKCYYN